eukprot:1569373-Prymnesium_polylepis.1
MCIRDRFRAAGQARWLRRILSAGAADTAAAATTVATTSGATATTAVAPPRATLCLPPCDQPRKGAPTPSGATGAADGVAGAAGSAGELRLDCLESLRGATLWVPAGDRGEEAWV